MGCIADIEELETMDASEIYSTRLNAKEVIVPKENGIFSRGKSRRFSRRIDQKGLFHHLKTHIRMLVKREMTFGPCQETSHTTITLNPESNFTRREKNHSLFH